MVSVFVFILLFFCCCCCCCFFFLSLFLKIGRGGGIKNPEKKLFAKAEKPKSGAHKDYGLMSPNLSVSVVLVSRKVNFLRSISFAVFVFWLFLADRSLADPT